MSTYKKCPFCGNDAKTFAPDKDGNVISCVLGHAPMRSIEGWETRYQEYPIQSHRFILQILKNDGSKIKDFYWISDVKSLSDIPSKVRELIGQYKIKLTPSVIDLLEVSYLMNNGEYKFIGRTEKLTWIKENSYVNRNTM